MPFWRFIKKQYDTAIRAAGTSFAEKVLYIFSALESIIFPIPVDPLLIATVISRPFLWLRLATGCTICSVIGGAIGWTIGALFENKVDGWLSILPFKESAISTFSLVEIGFSEFGIFLVFLGAFSPLPYKIIAVSAGLTGFGLTPFVIVSLIGRGLRFTLIAAITFNCGRPRYFIFLTSILLLLVGVALWLTK